MLHMDCVLGNLNLQLVRMGFLQQHILPFPVVVALACVCRGVTGSFVSWSSLGVVVIAVLLHHQWAYARPMAKLPCCQGGGTHWGGGLFTLMKLAVVKGGNEPDVISYWDAQARREEVRKAGFFVMNFFPLWVPLRAGVVLVVDTELVKGMLALKQQHKYVKGQSYDVSRPLIGSGLLSSSGPAWQAQRKVADVGFKSPVLDNAVQVNPPARPPASPPAQSQFQWRAVPESFKESACLGFLHRC